MFHDKTCFLFSHKDEEGSKIAMFIMEY